MGHVRVVDALYLKELAAGECGSCWAIHHVIPYIV
jgi:hypothetical protein